MKLGIAMLVVGALLAGLGLAAWQMASSLIVTLWGVPVNDDWELCMLVKSAGMGAVVFGGLVAIGGLVRMIVKRAS